MENIRKYTYFEIRKKAKVVEIEPISSEINDQIINELRSVLAMAFYETNRHVKLEMSKFESLPFSVVEKLIKFAMDLREKNRVFILSKPSPQIRKYIRTFSLDELLLIL
ncbi:STAS domain protein [Leptospira langatensis]|uniref:STAS domain protein n=1 Tax=Leptospira langatensis TaxID=2484983 RepID=A0A5F1ZPV3_9LEPT|nr:STAS domain-containing protein [Leptospira langatensis]TGK01757.1 STAS domain protein [Leptospira langatensis]TGL39363.1 STAS domain protein [Leptospira langatensis]